MVALFLMWFIKECGKEENTKRWRWNLNIFWIFGPGNVGFHDGTIGLIVFHKSWLNHHSKSGRGVQRVCRKSWFFALSQGNRPWPSFSKTWAELRQPGFAEGPAPFLIIIRDVWPQQNPYIHHLSWKKSHWGIKSQVFHPFVQLVNEFPPLFKDNFLIQRKATTLFGEKKCVFWGRAGEMKQIQILGWRVWGVIWTAKKKKETEKGAVTRVSGWKWLYLVVVSSSYPPQKLT